MLTGRLSGGAFVTSTPRSSIRPAVGSSKPPIIRRVVVLPQPDGPSSEKNSPDRISSEMSSTARTSPNRFETLDRRISGTASETVMRRSLRDGFRRGATCPVKRNRAARSPAARRQPVAVIDSSATVGTADGGA